MENVFEKGCLVQLSTSIWGASRKIKSEQLPNTSVSQEWLTARKKLVSPDALKPIQKIANTGRTYLGNISLPFPIHGMLFIPKEMISMVDDRLDTIKNEFHYAVNAFIENYPQLRQAAMSYLGDLFNEMDYPIDIERKFAFMWRFITMDVPNGNTAILAPEVYEREKEKFVKTMEEAREMAVHALRSEFALLINRIVDRFSNGVEGKPKVFKNTTVDSFYEFFETFKQRNIFHDKDLENLVERAQDILNGQSPDRIRTNDHLKEDIKNGMAYVETEMAELFSMPRRKILLN